VNNSQTFLEVDQSMTKILKKDKNDVSVIDEMPEL